MLLDDFLPTYQINQVHQVKVQASPERIMRAIKELMPGELSPVVRLLFALRALPERLFGKSGLQFSGDGSFLEQMFANGFILLQEKADRELVFGFVAPGSIGRFWKRDTHSTALPGDAQTFDAFEHPGFVKVAANFLIEQRQGGSALVSTDTRIQALSPQAHKSFGKYWLVIHPWSSLIRRLWLRAVKKRAERNMA